MFRCANLGDLTLHRIKNARTLGSSQRFSRREVMTMSAQDWALLLPILIGGALAAYDRWIAYKDSHKK